MTYGLQIFNDSSQLVISSDGIGYKYLGTPTLVSVATKTYGTDTQDITPYIYTMNLPGNGVGLYPLVGVKLDSSAVVDIVSIQCAETSFIDHIIGLSNVRRAVSTSTGAIYLDSYSVGGAPFVTGNGPLYVRNGAIYELNTTYNRYDLFLYLKGYQAVVLSSSDHDPLEYKGTLTIQVNSVNILTSNSMSSIAFTPPSLYVFTPYSNSDGASGYGLNLYNSSGSLTFSSNQQVLSIDQKIEFAGYTSYSSSQLTPIMRDGQSMPCIPLSTAIILNSSGAGYVEATRNQAALPREPINYFNRRYGWSYTGDTLKRVTYVTQTTTQSTSGTTYYDTTISSTTAILVDGSTLVPSTNFTGTLSTPNAVLSTYGNNPQSIAISSDRLSVYVTNINGANISQYYCDSNGALTYIRTLATSTYTSPNQVTIHPFGVYVYVACAGGGIVLFRKESSPTGPYPAGSGYGYLSVLATYALPETYFVTISPDGNYLYASSFSVSANAIHRYNIDTSTGYLSNYTVMNSQGTGNFGWVISPDGLFLYQCLYISNQVSAYSRNIDTGALTHIGTVSAGVNPSYCVLSPSGTYLYVSNYGGAPGPHTIVKYSRDLNTGTLSSPVYISTPARPSGLIISSDNRFLYCAMYAADCINVYSINSSTGTLTYYSSIATGAQPYTLAMSSDDNNIYGVNTSGNTVQQYKRSRA